MGFFSDDSINSDERRNVAFQTLVAHRDLLAIANKRKQPPTYENALGLLNELAPDIYDEITKLLSRKNESELIRYFKDLAEIKSLNSSTTITAITLIDQQIEMLQALHEKDSSKSTVTKRLLEHRVAREKMNPIRLTENRIMNRDFSKVDRSDYATKHFENDHFIDYLVRDKNILRLRFLHPDKQEHITGADLIYEQYDLMREKVRFVFLQYKTWDDGVLYFSSSSNLAPQMAKMTALLCSQGLCLGAEGNNYSTTKYRLPFCAGFIRPTDKIQENDSKLMSTGFHVPLCKALQLSGETNKISKSDIKEQSFHSQIFEELFNENMIGSRWLDIQELDEFYSKNEIFSNTDRILLYAQEHLGTKKSAKENS